MRALLKTTLASVGATAYWVKWSGQGTPPSTYITYTIRERDALFASDFATEMTQSVYVEIWSDGDPATVYAAVKSAMKAAGFALVESVDIFEPEGYHISMSYNFVGV